MKCRHERFALNDTHFIAPFFSNLPIYLVHHSIPCPGRALVVGVSARALVEIFERIAQVARTWDDES